MRPTEPQQMPLLSPAPAATPDVLESHDPLNHGARLARLVGQQPETLPGIAVELWERLAARLVMIIGSDGFDALFDRSLHLSAVSHPWLALDEPIGEVREEPQVEASRQDEPRANPAEAPLADRQGRFARLSARLQKRAPEEACQATALLFTTFTGVLITLIGQQLTTNILRAAWVSTQPPAAQEASTCPTK